MDNVKDKKRIIEEMVRLHKEFVQTMRLLEKRQGELLRRVIERIDDERAKALLSDIESGNNRHISESI